jgi:hypothetical protein
MLFNFFDFKMFSGNLTEKLFWRKKRTGTIFFCNRLFTPFQTSPLMDHTRLWKLNKIPKNSH